MVGVKRLYQETHIPQLGLYERVYCHQFLCREGVGVVGIPFVRSLLQPQTIRFQLAVNPFSDGLLGHPSQIAHDRSRRKATAPSGGAMPPHNSFSLSAIFCAGSRSRSVVICT
jgi:hypothetical protein